MNRIRCAASSGFTVRHAPDYALMFYIMPSIRLRTLICQSSIANGHHTFLLFYLKDEYSEGKRTEAIALVQFHRCVSAKLGDPNDEVFHGHPLNGKGLEPYRAQIVRNSKWVKELESINKVHSQYDPEFWRSMKHYILWFHDETFECAARTYEVEIFQKSNPEESMDEVILEAVKRLRT